MGDHDTLFKRAFSVPAHAAGELRSVLPAGIADRFDLTELELVPASFVDAELEHRHADLLFRVPLGGRPSYVYFLFEHQSEPDDLMPWRVLTYQQRIWASILRAEPTRKTLPPVVTIVVHHGERSWTSPRRFHSLVDGLDELPALAPCDAFFEHLAAWGAELERLVREDPSREDVFVVLRYILRVAGDAPYEIVRQRIAEVAPSIEETMATAEEQLIQRGMEKGRAEGIEKGIRSMLLLQLRGRFGVLDDAVEKRILLAPFADLERWIKRVLIAERLDDVFAEAPSEPRA